MSVYNKGENKGEKRSDTPTDKRICKFLYNIIIDNYSPTRILDPCCGDKRLTELETNIDKRVTELENKFTPIGDGVYSVDPTGTWPPSRGEYKMKDEMSRNKILVLEETIDRLEKELEKIENKLDKKADKE